MNKITNILQDILDREIKSAKSILLTSHINPDGDGIGSELGFYYHLSDIGKECRIINSSKLPDLYTFLDTRHVIETYKTVFDQWIKNVDLVIILDIGEIKRIGDMRKLFSPKTITICIDHHPVRHESDYSFTIVDTHEPSTGSMVYHYLVNARQSKLMPLDVAIPLYVALITDTGSFRYSNTNSSSHEMAARLIESGVKPHEIQRHIYESRPLVQVRLLGKVIDGIKFDFSDQFAWFIIDAKMLNDHGATPEDIEGFTDFIRSINGVEIACMILELPDRKIRLNFRSKGIYSVNDIAEKFKGGGHPFAAGAIIDKCDIVSAEKMILYEIQHKIQGTAHVD